MKNRLLIAFVLAPDDGSSWAVRVSPPWELRVARQEDYIFDASDGDPICDAKPFTNCYEGPLATRRNNLPSLGRYLFIGTNADPAPARNVTMEHGGHCP